MPPIAKAVWMAKRGLEILAFRVSDGVDYKIVPFICDCFNRWGLLYADDTMIFGTHTASLNKLLRKIQNESEYYNLKLNEKMHKHHGKANAIFNKVQKWYTNEKIEIVDVFLEAFKRFSHIGGQLENPSTAFARPLAFHSSRHAMDFDRDFSARPLLHPSDLSPVGVLTDCATEGCLRCTPPRKQPRLPTPTTVPNGQPGRLKSMCSCVSDATCVFGSNTWIAYRQ